MNLRPSAIAFCLALLGAHLRAASLPVLVKAGGMVESMFSGNNQSLSNASFYLQTRQTASAQITASAQATETSFSIIASANIVADPGDVYPPRSPFYPETVDAYASITDIAGQGPNAYFTFGESNAFACEVSLPYAPSHDGSLNPSFSVGFYDAINSHTIFSFGTSGGSGPLVKTKSGVVPPGTYYVQLNAYWGWTAGYDAKGWQGQIFVYDYGPAFSLSSSYSAAISFVSLARPDLAAVKLALDLTAANAVCTYSVSGSDAPAGTRIGVYWATGQTVADIIGTVFEQNLPRSEVGTYQFYRANLPAAMPLATYALLVIDPPTPGNPNGSVLEAREDNNVYPFPIVPIAPTVQIVIARAASSTTASGAAVDAEGDPLFRKEFYKAWVRVANNSNQSMGISGDWTESLPTSPPIEPPTQHGTFSDTAIDGGCVTFLPLKDATSGDLFRRTWDWVPPTEPFTLSKAQHEMEAQLVKELAVIGLENLPKNAEGLHVAVSLATLVKHVVDKSQATDQAIPQVELDVVAGMKWWPSVSPASFELTQSRATLVFEVPDEQQNAYRQYWTDRLLGDVYEGYAFIDMLLQPWVFWKTAIELKQAASHQYALAVDPPDTNFTQTAIAVTNYPAEIASMPEGPTKKLAINVFDLGSVTEAKITALNRAQGAEAVGAFDWQARQLESAAGHARASAMLQISALLLTKQLDPEIQRTVANNEQSLVPSLQQNGLPANIVTNLMQLGWTAAQIEEYRTNLIDIGTSLLDQPGLNQLSYVLGVCLASDDASRLLSTAAAIRRDMLGIPPTAITTEQRQQLSSGQAQLEIALASGTNLDAILAILNTYATNLDQITEQSANLDSLQSEAGFGDLALGSVLAQVVDPADYVSLSVQYASNCVVLSWPALSSLALERSTSLTQPQWQAANLTPTNQWGEYLVSLPPTNGAAFFSLRKVVPSPVIQADLSAFSTNAFGIAVVSKPVVSGTIANGTNISWMLGGFVTNGSVIFSDLSSSLSPYFKRFSIGRSELEQVNGGPLLDGTYTFRLKALDLQSNVVSSSDFTFQLDTHAPTLYLSNSVADVDTNTPGIQTVEYSTLRFRSGIFDDGGVSKLELLMNSNVLVTGTFFPWEDFLVQAPAYVAGSNLFRIQTRGTDLAGNTALSAPVDIEVVPDGTNPTVASVSPLDGMTLTNLNVDHVTVSFSKPISPGSLNPTNFILLEAGPNGLFGDGDDVVIRVSDLLLSDDDTVVRIGFPALLFGSYQIRLAATRIMDRTGHSLGTNELGVVVGQFKVSPVADLRLTSKCQSSLSTLPERADKESP